MNTEAHTRNEAVAILNATRESIGAGTIVTLKTGGPAMVVSERTTDKANCLWHQEDGNIVSMWINLVCLKVKP